MEYVCSVCDDSTGRIRGIKARVTNVPVDGGGSLKVFRVITFGTELKIWDWFSARDRRASR
jgi:hypothetical protein